MKRLFALAAATATTIALAFALAPTQPAISATPAPGAATAEDAPTPCVTTDFKTDVVKAACAKGGQDEAKDVMKAQVKAWKAKTGEKITCKTCHENLTPNYELKANAHDDFKKFQAALGGADDGALTPAEQATLRAF